MTSLNNFGLRELNIEDAQLYSKYIKSSSYFTGLWASNYPYIWCISRLKSLKVVWKIIDNMLVTFILTKKQFMYMWCLPFGQGNADHVLKVTVKSLLLCNEWNNLNNIKRHAYVNLLNERQILFLSSSKKFRKTFLYKQYKSKEIIWSLEKLVKLEGKNFREIRATRNKLIREHPSIILREYTSSDYENVIALKELWNKTSGKKYKKITDQHLFNQILHNYKELDELIYVATIEERVVGFVTGSILPNGIAWGCISKADPNIKGLSIFLYIEFAKILKAKDPSVNLLHVGSDNNEKGLQQFKDKFRPVEKLHLYALKLRNYH